MKIAILTSGILPIPAVLGGAVENLIDFYLEYNEEHQLHDITIYSVSLPRTKNHPARISKVNHYYYIDVNSLWARIKRKLYFYIHGEGYHHYFIEYFLDQSIKHIKKQNYDCIILENRPSYSLKLKAITTAKLVYHLHNEKLTTQTPGYQDIYEAASRIICVSNYITGSVRSINSHDTKCTTVYNGIDLAAFSTKNGIISRKDIGLDDHDFVLIFSGRINPEKGIVELIKAMSLLHKHCNIKLLVIGGSFFGNEIQDNVFIKQIREMASPIKKNIIFTGYIPYKNMPDYLKLANIAVVPSIWNDPFPTTILEAQAIGLPIITTRNGGIPEEVTKENAILLETNELFVENLAKSILYLYHNPPKCNTMSKASLVHSKIFDKERFAKDFFDALDALPDAKQQF